MNKAVIFDLDGTLVDSIADIAACMNHTFEQHNLPTYTVDQYRYLVGSGIKTVIIKALPENLHYMTQQLSDAYEPYYIVHNCDHSKPFPGTIEMLDKLRKAGIKLGVLSNKPHTQTLSVIDKLFGLDRFDAVWGHMEDKYPRKPQPDSLLAMIEYLGSDRENTIYVGDSDIDIQVARNAEVTEAGVVWGLRPPDELYELKTKFMANDMAELEEFLLEKSGVAKKA